MKIKIPEIGHTCPHQTYVDYRAQIS